VARTAPAASVMTRICIAFAVLFGVCYGGAAWWTGRYASLPVWDFAFEQRVPFVPEAAVLYLTITPALLLAPWVFRTRSELAPFAAALAIETVIATICFLLFPQTTSFARPPVDQLPFRIADAMNLEYNQFPSLHVAFAVSAAWAYGQKRFRWAWIAWSAAVALSTWLMHEHHLVDIAGGVALAVLIMKFVYPRLWVELCCLEQCAQFSRRHIRYFVIFLAIWGPSLLHWRRYRAARVGFCAAQWIDDLLDGDRPSDREPLEIAGELVEEMQRDRFSSSSLSLLTAALFAELGDEGRREFIALVRTMMRDRERVLGRETWTEEELDAHHQETFRLSVDLMLITARCATRAAAAPSLIAVFAWCSVFRDLADDLTKGLINIPRGVSMDVWDRESHRRACAALVRAQEEIAAIPEARARRILGLFQRSIARFAARRAPTGRVVAVDGGGAISSS
jgi:membrane-associated phospholipid phosphatase